MLIRRIALPVVVLTSLALLAAACGDNDDGESSPPSEIQATETPVGIDLVASSGIVGGDPDFNFVALTWQGYWLSRDHFGPFVMASGMGIPFEPPMEMLQQAMEMVAQNPDDVVMIPANMAPLQAIYASGSPNLLNDPRDFDPLDFEGFRLDPDSFDVTVSVRGQAETMLKESQWAHNFANAHFGEPEGDFGAQQRFIGMMVAMLSQMQGQYAMQELLGDDGLYHDSDGALDFTGNWVMLHGLSDIAGLTSDRGELNHGRYMAPDAHQAFEGAANGLLAALEDREPASADEAAAAIRALAYRAWTADDTAVAERALSRARAIADEQLVDFTSEDVTQLAAAVTGLIATSAATDDEKYRDAADAIFDRLADDFDPEHGVFKSKSVYSVDDVAWIIAGLNSLTQLGGDATKGPASRALLAFYESTISLAGMQLSAPPGKDGAMASEWEKDLPSVVYYHPADTPSPPAAGKLPVPASEVTWDGDSWEVTSDTFVPAGAMHLANELNWIGPHLGSIPFPPVTDAVSNQVPDAGAPVTSATLVGKKIAFDVDALTVPAGQEVTITFDNQDAAVPHNLHVQAGPEGDFKTEIVEGPVLHTDFRDRRTREL
ncbi:MAG: hypothetical protein IIC86_03500 [Chloroflexi bacterium]|nr:hypothetical protein [Chloroflexota bacterium]